MGVPGRREDDATADDDGEEVWGMTGMGDADVVLVMMGDECGGEERRTKLW